MPFGVVPHVPNDDVGELSFVASARFPFAFVLPNLSCQVLFSRWVATSLSNVDDVQDRVYCAVPAQVESMSSGWAMPFARGHCDGCYSTPTGESGFAGEPVRVADLDEKVHRCHDTDTVQIGERRSEFGDYRGNLPVEFLDPFGQGGDVEQAGGEPVELELVGRGELAGSGVAVGERDELREHAAGRGQRVANRHGQGDEYGFGLGEQPDALQDQGRAPVAEHGERLPCRARCGVLSGRRQVRVGQGLAGDGFGVLDVGLGLVLARRRRLRRSAVRLAARAGLVSV